METLSTGNENADFVLCVANAIATVNGTNPDKPNFRKDFPADLKATDESVRAALPEVQNPEFRDRINQVLGMKDDDPKKQEIIKGIDYYLLAIRISRHA